jgi:hypothetical protein
VLSNVIGMIMQYLYVGAGPFNWRGLLGLNQDPILPKALEVRQSVIDRVNAGREQEAIEGAASEPGANGAAARRRRRYSSGRRRGRGKNS